MIALATGNFHLQLGLSSFLTQMSRAKSQAIPPKISTFSGLKFFAGDGVGRGHARRRRGAVFLQSQHARILSRLRVSPVDGVELSGLRRHARGLCSCCTDILRALKDNALLVLSLAGLAATGRVVRNPKSSAPPGRTVFAAEIFLAPARRRRGFHRAAKFAGIFISFAVEARWRLRRAGKRPTFSLLQARVLVFNR